VRQRRGGKSGKYELDGYGALIKQNKREEDERSSCTTMVLLPLRPCIF